MVISFLYKDKPLLLYVPIIRREIDIEEERSLEPLPIKLKSKSKSKSLIARRTRVNSISNQ